MKPEYTPFMREHNSIFESFILDYEDYLNGDTPPRRINADMKLALELQRKRFESSGIERKYKIPSRMNGYSGRIVKKWSDGKYTGTLDVKPCCIKGKLIRDGKIIYKRDEQVNMYQTRLDVSDPEYIRNDTCCCPNCGNVSTIKQLGEGCPYCGTFFKNTDLFPCISEFYLLKNSPFGDKGFKGDFIKFYPVGCLLSFLIFFFTEQDMHIVGMIAASLIAGIFTSGAIVFYKMMFTLILELIKSFPLLIAQISSKSNFERNMKAYDENFSFDYFCNKATMLAELITFSDNPEKQAVYAGDKIHSDLSNILDLSYSGALKLNHFYMKENICYVEVELYADVLSDMGRKVKKMRNCIKMRMKRDVTKDIDLSASPLKVQCHGCGASFNAMKIDTCPYCKRPYEKDFSDWTVTGIEYKNMILTTIIMVIVGIYFFGMILFTLVKIMSLR